MRMTDPAPMSDRQMEALAEALLRLMKRMGLDKPLDSGLKKAAEKRDN